MGTCLNLYILAVRYFFCIPRITLKFIIAPWNNQLTRIVLEVNNYHSMIEKENRICTKAPIFLIKWITNKNAIVIVLFERGIYYLDHAAELLILVRCCLLM